MQQLMRLLFWTVVLLIPNLIFGQTFEENVIILKIKPEYKSQLSDTGIQIESVNQVFGATEVKFSKKFPFSKAPAVNKSNSREVDITTIYKVEVNAGKNLEKYIRELNKLTEVAYAEPHYLDFTTLTPNDPDLALQYHLTNINAFTAWGIQPGASSTKIAIIDTGTDIDHPDLVGNMYTNSSDPINGVDDDGNGYIDDYYGWDFIDEDGIPDGDGANHGVHVAGIAGAKPNNSIGIAGTGYNCSIVSIRTGNDQTILYGYDGIVYAADQGFDVINCSWGSSSYSQYAQDVVTYASVNQNALVVAASGNNGQDNYFYPAAYDYVLSVGATNASDEVTSFTNYGYWLDILAPGQSIYSTMPDGEYNYNSGTSMAAPVVSGIAGLVKSQYSSLTGLQIAERLKTTITDISNVGNNSTYGDKMGFGLVNAYEALNGIVSGPSVVYEEIQISDENDESFAVGDTIRIGGIFTNYLGASDSLSAVMSSTSSNISFIDSSYAIGELPASGTVINYNNPFSFIITDSASMNEELVLTLAISDGTYSVAQYIELTVNVNYLNVTVNNINTSIGGNSSIGKIDAAKQVGLGFTYNGSENQLYESGFMLGFQVNNLPFVIDNIRDGQSVDSDFAADTTIHQIFNSSNSDTAFQSYAAFGDLNGNGDSVGVTVINQVFAYESEGNEDYILLYYDIVNKSSNTLDSLYASIFTDWDVNSYDENKSAYDEDYRLAYAYSTDGNSGYYGVQHLGDGTPVVYSFDNVSGGNGGIDIYNSFNTTQKYKAMKSGRTEGGSGSSSGNDIIQMTSVGPFTLTPGDTQRVIFSMLAGNTLDDIQEAADSAYYKIYNQSPVGTEVIEQEQSEVILYPNPASDIVNCISDQEIEEIKVFSLSGLCLKTILNSNEIDISQFKSGVYLIQLKTNSGIEVQKLLKQP